jgi:hypothetical protein
MGKSYFQIRRHGIGADKKSCDSNKKRFTTSEGSFVSVFPAETTDFQD